MERRDEIVELRAVGVSYAEIGRTLSLSEQKVRQIMEGDHERLNHGFEAMLKTSDVARLLSVHINTVRRWSRKGILKAYRICSRGDLRFKQEDIDKFLQEGPVEM